MAAVEPTPGATIGDRFVLGERIGTGGFGSVWSARDQASRGAKVALKLLHTHHHEDPRIRQRFEREAEVLTRLDHPSIAKCVAWDVDDDSAYLALEYVDGITLARAMVRRVRRDQVFELDEIRRIFGELAAAVQFAHAMKVVHRDIKPANVMLLERAGTWYVKVLDFGVAKILAEASREHTSVGTLLGSLHYMGPEQAKGQVVDHRTDVFALGSVLFELLTLRRAWLRNVNGEPIQVGAPVKSGDADRSSDKAAAMNNDLALIMRLVQDPRPVPTEWRPDLPAAVDDVVARALAVRPEDRFASVEDMARAVDHALGTRPRAASSSTQDLPALRPSEGLGAASPSTSDAAPSGERRGWPTSRSSESRARAGFPPSDSRSAERRSPTFESSRPEALMEETAALWSRVDEALVREAGESRAEDPASPGPRWGRWALVAAGILALLAIGVVAARALAPAPPAKPPPAGRIVDVP